MRWLFAVLHLLGLGIGLGAIWIRARMLSGPLDLPGLRNVLAAHRWWGLAGHVWIVTGLVRVLGEFEKGPSFYLHNPLFHAKMGLFILILVLEVGPLVVLRRWKSEVASGSIPDTAQAPQFARTSMVQVVLVILMVIAATGMARGYGMQ